MYFSHLMASPIAYRVIAMRHGIHDCFVDRDGRELRQFLESAFRSSYQIGLEESGLLQKGTEIPYLFGDRPIKRSVEAGRGPVLPTIQRHVEAKHTDMRFNGWLTQRLSTAEACSGRSLML